jgi:hypothetical protein
MHLPDTATPAGIGPLAADAREFWRLPPHKLDSLLALRPTTPDDLSARWRRSKRFLVEVDAMPGRFFCTGALKRRLDTVDVEQALSDGLSLSALFTQKQLALLAAYAPAPFGFDELRIFGPVGVRRKALAARLLANAHQHTFMRGQG